MAIAQEVVHRYPRAAQKVKGRGARRALSSQEAYKQLILGEYLLVS